MIHNTPDLWGADFPQKTGDIHKYDCGHALIHGAPGLTGATRLAASACARMGAGLVTVLTDRGRGDFYRACLPAHIMVREDTGWKDTRVTARLCGPGGSASPPDFSLDIPTVLDAGALEFISGTLQGTYILTPHEGEFARIFPSIQGSRIEKALSAARQAGAILVLKGAETVIAAPDGRVAVNGHASALLATAGTGDVLAGMITGLLAQGMEPFKAACASAWIHGDCALRFGPGLVAEDLPDLIPQTLRGLFKV
ncbi:MAG: NAD(P)H-hydrate dehydratase [Alphaproteobacteria bacterium]|nr:NAD(P)H-hydrate dehydratase [Alphaproteobacteria bacterium]